MVVGTGIAAGAHLTAEARREIEAAEVVLALVADRVTLEWVRELNPQARSLHEHYRAGEDRRQSYERVVEAILEPVREGRRVCAVFYGHPGVFVQPSHEAIRRLRADGLRPRMLPGISAEDCLFADLGIDPGTCGCQSYDATVWTPRHSRC